MPLLGTITRLRMVSLVALVGCGSGPAAPPRSVPPVTKLAVEQPTLDAAPASGSAPSTVDRTRPASELVLGTDAQTEAWLARHGLEPNLVFPSGLRRLTEFFGAENLSCDVGFTRAEPDQGHPHPLLRWRLASTQASSSPERLERVRKRLEEMGFELVRTRDDGVLYRRSASGHRDDVELSWNAFTDNTGAPQETLQLVWSFALEQLGTEATLGQIFEVAPYLRHPNVDRELYELLEPLLVRGVENSARQLRRPYDWIGHKFWVIPPDEPVALVGRVARLLGERGFHVPESVAELTAGKSRESSDFELYFSRKPEEGLALLLMSLSGDAVMLALRIYTTNQPAVSMGSKAHRGDDALFDAGP